jgi:hypothetical protein
MATRSYQTVGKKSFSARNCQVDILKKKKLNVKNFYLGVVNGEVGSFFEKVLRDVDSRRFARIARVLESI